VSGRGLGVIERREEDNENKKERKGQLGFPTVRGPDRARRTDSQEPGTGRDGRKYAVLVCKI